MEIDLTEAQILRIQDGDLLVFRAPEPLSALGQERLVDAVRQFERSVESRTGKRIACAVLDAGLSIQVVRRE